MSSTELRKVRVKMEAETARYQRDLDKSRKETTKWRKKAESNVSGVAKAFRGLVAGAAIGLFAKQVVDATAAQERAVAQLQQGWKSTEGVVGLSVQQMTQHASDLQKVSLFGDEQIIEAQARLITFTNIAGDQFQKTTQLALDLSTRMGMDLNSATLQLGKALNDPVANLSALSRAGIQFNDQQKEQIKTLWESGDAVSAQTIILEELERQFGGSAAAARDTFGGALVGLQNAFADLWESSQGLDDAKESIEELTALMQDPKTVSAANELTSAVVAGMAKAVEGLTNLIDFVKVLGVQLGYIASIAPDVGKALASALNPFDGTSPAEAADSLRARIRMFERVRDEEIERLAASSAGVSGVSGASVVGSVSPIAPVGGSVDPENSVEVVAQAAILQRKEENQAAHDDKIAERQALRAESELQALQNQFLTEEERLLQMRENRLAIVENALERELISEQAALDLRNKITEDSDKKLRSMQSNTYVSLLNVADNYYTALGGRQSANAKLAISLAKTMLDAEKRAKLKEVLMNTPSMAAKAYDSVVGIPYVGPFLAPAAAGAAYAFGASQAAEIAGIAHGGLTNVPSESTYLLDKNERVLSPRQNEDLTNFLADDGGSGSGSAAQVSSVMIYINGIQTTPDQDEIDDNIRSIVIEQTSDKTSQTMQNLYNGSSMEPVGDM